MEGEKKAKLNNKVYQQAAIQGYFADLQKVTQIEIIIILGLYDKITIIKAFLRLHNLRDADRGTRYTQYIESQ